MMNRLACILAGYQLTMEHDLNSRSSHAAKRTHLGTGLWAAYSTYRTCKQTTLVDRLVNRAILNVCTCIGAQSGG